MISQQEEEENQQQQQQQQSHSYDRHVPRGQKSRKSRSGNTKDETKYDYHTSL